MTVAPPEVSLKKIFKAELDTLNKKPIFHLLSLFNEYGNIVYSDYLAADKLIEPETCPAPPAAHFEDNVASCQAACLGNGRHRREGCFAVGVDVALPFLHEEALADAKGIREEIG